MNTDKVIKIIDRIYDLELSGVLRYTHYSLMVFGPHRIPLRDFFNAQATESLAHANIAGEHITGLGGHPTLNIEDIEETHKHSTADILNEALEHERGAISAYYELLDSVENESVYLEEYARSMIGQEELHVIEVEKMLKEH